MARYRKFHSKYSLEKKHETLTNGDTIWEKDWSTVRGPIIGNFGTNSKRKYTDGNFTFITSNIPSPEKKHTISKEGDVYTYEEVKDAVREDTINSKQPQHNSDDLRSYAYFGSAYELVKNSVEDIVSKFPPKMYTNHANLSIPPLAGDMTHDIEYAATKDGKPYYTLLNPFNVDFITQNPTLDENGNPMRFMSLSFPSYKVITYKDGEADCEYSIDSYEIEPSDDGLNLDACSDNYQLDYRWSNYDLTSPVYMISLRLSPYCPTTASAVAASKDVDDCETQADGTAEDTQQPCKNEGCPLTEMALAVYKYGDNWIYVSETDGISIEANDEVMNDFFSNLSGFEKQLLNKNTTPLYTNTFKEPHGDLMDMRWTNATYTFPTIYDPNTSDHESYFIDTENAAFSDYIKRISDLALVLDEMFTDNIWRRLTHEAIKNFDWSWQTNNETAEDYGVEGGERMHKVMDVMGRSFDDVKFHIDHIKNLNAVTYSGTNNTSNTKLNEIDEHLGWEVPSIKDILFREPINKDMTKVALTKDFFDSKTNGITNTQWNPKHYKWFPSLNPEDYNADRCDVLFKRYLALSAKHIMRSKGTNHSIEMINALFGIGDNDIKLSNEVKQLSALKVVTPEEIDLIKLWLSYRLTETYEDECEFPNIPLKHVNYKVNGEYLDFLLPYFDNNYVYDGDLIYQGDGGWATIDASNEYEETFCYLKNKRDIKELQQLNPVSELAEGEIFHVGSLYGYKYNVTNTSHYFVIADGKSSLPEYVDNWLNIPFKIDSSTKEYVSLDRSEFDTYVTEVNKTRNGEKTASDPEYRHISYDATDDGYLKYLSYFRKVQYLSKVISCNDGNHPHTGYGNYDFGEKYFQYMNNPLQYFCDNSDALEEDILEALKELVLPTADGYILTDKEIDDINYDENIEIKINYI